MAEKLICIYALWNVIIFLLYGIDKYKAVKNKWRISEKTLLGCAVLMGGIGATLGMEIFRHKTKKPLFRLGVPAAVVLNIAVIYFIGRV